MDNDTFPDHNFMKIKEKLNKEQIKLWLSPYLNDGREKNVEELQKLAIIFSKDLSIPVEICLKYLEQFQSKALDNLKERDNYKNTGQASLKVKVPNEQGGSTLTICIELSKTGSELKEELSKAVAVPVVRLKVICKGKFIKDDLTLESQGIKHGLHMMAIVLKEYSDSLIPKYESYVTQLDSTKADIELLSKGQYFQVADQTGKLLKLPPEERKSLITAMTLHEKGRSALKKEDYAFALVMLLEAEKEFRVDNYGVLSLDIVWCYLNLQSVTQLPDAEERLRQCEHSFEQSYGTNMERLTALKGFTGNELALFMRLHLLQAIVLYHQNRIEEARLLLHKAEEGLRNLQMDDSQLCQLIELGYGMTEARLALRASRGDLNTAVTIIENKRQEKRKNEELEAQERQLQKKRKKLGKCLNGEWVDPQLHNTLMSMGFSYEVSKWALAQSNNNINAGINLIHGDPEKAAEQASGSGHNQPRDESLQKVIDVGFEEGIAKRALKKHEGDPQKAIEDLLANGGITENDLDSSDDDDDVDGPCSSEMKKKKDEAYSRLKEGISATEDDHLDLNLVTEAAFLKKYKQLLSNRQGT